MKRLVCLLVLSGCAEDVIGDTNAGEVITRVELQIANQTFAFEDPDGDGGAPPTIDPITLSAGGPYPATMRFLNTLEDPPEDITLEVQDEGDQHQVFFTGSAVDTILQHAYADMDANGLPIGLDNRITATPGTGALTVTLRHLPPINDKPQKTADLASQVKAAGTLAAIGGESDAVVTFSVTVQ